MKGVLWLAGVPHTLHCDCAEQCAKQHTACSDIGSAPGMSGGQHIVQHSKIELVLDLRLGSLPW